MIKSIILDEIHFNENSKLSPNVILNLQQSNFIEISTILFIIKFTIYIFYKIVII